MTRMRLMSPVKRAYEEQQFSKRLLKRRKMDLRDFAFGVLKSSPTGATIALFATNAFS